MAKRDHDAKKARKTARMSPSSKRRGEMTPDEMEDQAAERRSDDIKGAIPMRGGRPARPMRK
jgi:hypothetical protein